MPLSSLWYEANISCLIKTIAFGNSGSVFLFEDKPPQMEIVSEGIV